LLKIDVSAQQAHFTWAHRQLKAPRHYLKSAPPLPQALYFNCQAIADLLAAQNPLNLAKADLHYLHQHLTGFSEIINSAVHTTSTRCKLIFDYFQIHEHLNHHATIKNILRISSQTGTPAPRSSLLQLMPLNAPAQAQKQQPVSALNSHNDVAMPVYSVHPTHTKNYYVTTVPNLAIQCDMPVLLIDTTEHIKLGILRQITAHPVMVSQQILIEHIPGTLESVQAIIDEEATLGILITTAANEMEILLPPGKYQNGAEFIMIRQSVQKPYRFMELLQFKSRYLHYKISPG
jgi:hypothetical protein